VPSLRMRETVCSPHTSSVASCLSKYRRDLSNNSVGRATNYDLDDLASIFGMGKIFLFFTGSRPALGPTQPPIQYALGGSLPLSKVAGA
jgi:hypothetical protein